MTFISYKNFAIKELYYIVSGKNTLEDKKTNTGNKPVHDHLTQIKSLSKQSEETNTRGNFRRKKILIFKKKKMFKGE